jgi:hypothetical protein
MNLTVGINIIKSVVFVCVVFLVVAAVLVFKMLRSHEEER